MKFIARLSAVLAAMVWASAAFADINIGVHPVLDRSRGLSGYPRAEHS